MRGQVPTNHVHLLTAGLGMAGLVLQQLMFGDPPSGGSGGGGVHGGIRGGGGGEESWPFGGQIGLVRLPAHTAKSDCETTCLNATLCMCRIMCCYAVFTSVHIDFLIYLNVFQEHLACALAVAIAILSQLGRWLQLCYRKPALVPSQSQQPLIRPRRVFLPPWPSLKSGLKLIAQCDPAIVFVSDGGDGMLGSAVYVGAYDTATSAQPAGAHTDVGSVLSVPPSPRHANKPQTACSRPFDASSTRTTQHMQHFDTICTTPDLLCNDSSRQQASTSITPEPSSPSHARVRIKLAARESLSPSHKAAIQQNLNRYLMV